MTVRSLHHAPPLALPAAPGDLVHVASVDDAAWWTARLDESGGRLCVTVGARSALCERVRATGRVRLVCFLDGTCAEQMCAAEVREGASGHAQLLLQPLGAPSVFAQDASEPPRT